jgi:hypothetical protein
VQPAQNVHSNVQMCASSVGASARPQRSQEVRISSATARAYRGGESAPATRRYAATLRSFCDSAIAWSFFRLWFSI